MSAGRDARYAILVFILFFNSVTGRRKYEKEVPHNLCEYIQRFVVTAAVRTAAVSCYAVRIAAGANSTVTDKNETETLGEGTTACRHH